MEKSKQIEKEIIMKLKDLLKEAVAEISYKKSGLKNPNLAYLNKDKEISSWEKKRGGAIEKNMKNEFKSQAPKKEGIKFGNEERPMETMPSLSRSEMSAMDSRNNMCKECGAPMMYEDKMCMECGYMEVEEATLYGKDEAMDDGSPSAEDIAAADGGDGMGESEDHEVSMAQNSLKAIVSAASELMNKMGQDEKDIPAWIQDHITNAENYIQQASQNYHEYGEPEHKDGVDLEDLMEAKKKPSAGLSKAQKSTIAKKATAGKDIGKKGKGFAAIEKKAKESGADNPKAVAAAAMWKGAAKRANK
jgi:hypothetical protein